MRTHFLSVVPAATIGILLFITVVHERATTTDRSNRQMDVPAISVVPVLRFSDNNEKEREEGYKIDLEFDVINTSEADFLYTRTAGSGIYHLQIGVFSNGRPVRRRFFERRPSFGKAVLAPGARITHIIDIEQYYGTLKPGKYEVRALYNIPGTNQYGISAVQLDKAVLHFVIE